jgi:hypothetical protein
MGKLTIRRVAMNNREELYESLVRLALMLIFMCSLTAGTYGLVSICQMLVREHLIRPGSATYTMIDSQ